MRWSPKPPEIGPLDGFDETDLFEYREFGQHLAKLIGSLEDDPVLVLDGPWGSGKTTFSHQLAGVLRKQGHAVAYFDAFAADHHKDPFLALVEEVHCLATEADLDPDPEILRNFRKVAVSVGKELVLTTLDLALPGLRRFADLAIENGSQPDPSLLEAWIKQAAARKKTIADFRQCLEELASALADKPAEKPSDTPMETEQGSSIHPRLVFIVDELDRCQPLFALGLLERIKHIFGVQRVTFVLVANLDELVKCVRKVYGDVDAERYLEKFFEIVVELPKENGVGQNVKIEQYVSHLLQELGFPRQFFDHRYLGALGRLAESDSLTLRMLEHVMRQALVLMHSGMNRDAPFLSFVRVTRPVLFERIRQGRRDLFSPEEQEMFVDLWNLAQDSDDGEAVLTQLAPVGDLAHRARLLAQFRV